MVIPRLVLIESVLSVHFTGSGSKLRPVLGQNGPKWTGSKDPKWTVLQSKIGRSVRIEVDGHKTESGRSKNGRSKEKQLEDHQDESRRFKNIEG